MSGDNPGGAPNLVLTQKAPPTHSGHAVKSQRNASFAGPPPSPSDVSIGINLGIRIKTAQTPTLVISSKATVTSIPLTQLGPADPVVGDLNTGLGVAADEKWVAYNLTWKKSYKLKFESDLTLDPFDTIIGDNGFQVVTTAFCHDTQTFSGGVYSYAISVLPGKNSSGFPLSMGSTTSAAKKSASGKKTVKAKAKAKRRGAPKRKARR